jgi:hypothetical protein
VVLVVLLGAKQCSLDKANTSVTVFKDSTGYYKNLHNEAYASNQSLILTKKQLQLENTELYSEISKLKETPIFITKIVTKLVYRDTSLHTIIYSYVDSRGNKTFKLNWSQDTTYSSMNYVKLNGKSLLEIDSALRVLKYSSVLDTLQIGSKIYVSLTEDPKEKKLKINVRSDFPGLMFTDIDGFMIDPTKSVEIKKFFPAKRYGVSLLAGPGICIGTGVSAGIVIGVGVSWSLFQW